MTTLGFDKPLYILPFDHRGSFQTKMFGWKGVLTPAQTAEIAAAKQVIYDGFKAAVQDGVPEQKAGILTDEQFGSAIALADGRLEDAAAMAWRSYEAGQLLTGQDASGTYGIQMFGLRREQARLAELAPVMRIITAGDRAHGPWRPGLVSLLVELA